MDFLILIFFIVAFDIGIHCLQKCNVTYSTSCSSKDVNTNRIFIDNLPPEGKCSSVKIDNTTFIYDRVNITKIWITLVNENKDCTLKSMEQFRKDLKLVTEDVVFIDVDKSFFRFVFINVTNDTNKIASFPSKFEQKLQNAKLKLFSVANDPDTLGKVCLNGGKLNNNYTGAGYRCICHKNSISFGPRCEYMDRVLNSSIYYFSIFRNADIINLTFSLFCNGVKNNQSLLTIKNSTFSKVAEVSVRESTLFLKTADQNRNASFAIDGQFWNEFYLDISKEDVTLRVLNVSLYIKFTTVIDESFISHYLVLKEDNSNEFNICIRNLKINEQITDLNNADGYESCCLDRCQCSENQDCACKPFFSMSYTKCYCKFGYVLNGSICTPHLLKYSEIRDSQVVLFNQKEKLFRMDLLFRTLSTTGTIVTLIPSVSYTTISAKIVDTNLTLYLNNQPTYRPINYNVSDGEYHIVTLNVKDFNLEMILDDNANYSVAISNWSVNFTTSIIYSSFSLGPFYKPFNSTLNTFTTCFSTVRINGINESQYDIIIASNNETIPGCREGPRCIGTVNITCPQYEVCKDNEWQNTKCICIANFTSVDSTCVYNKCIQNPCQNKGVCTFNISDSYCKCTSGYTGEFCEIKPVTQAQLWWIAILIVLLLLLILLIILLVYCCCCRPKHNMTGAPYIDKIQENTVIYNEQAGESDYNGPPINYDLMKAALYNQNIPSKVPIYPTPEFVSKKVDLENNNNDLILDHPLEYGFEGYNSDVESVSSLGSNSTNSQLNIKPLENTNNHFNHLNKLYKNK